MTPITHKSKFLIFIFFQAEDGIRDTSVTGVQTCALPIFLRLPEIGIVRPPIRSMGWGRTMPISGRRRMPRSFVYWPKRRSEERRVGEGGRVRCWRWVKVEDATAGNEVGDWEA